MRLAEIAEHLVGRQMCLGCGTPGPLLCGPCARQVESAVPVQDLPGISGAESVRLLVAYDYSGPARQLVLELKMSGRLRTASVLGRALQRTVMRAGIHGHIVTWVPGGRSEIVRRGFDHAHAIAQDLARRLGLPLRATLEGASGRADQAGLGARARVANAAGSFTTPVGLDLAGAEIVLVDDLLTTGATARVCAQALLEAGAAVVEVAVACRAPEPAKGGPSGDPTYLGKIA